MGDRISSRFRFGKVVAWGILFAIGMILRNQTKVAIRKAWLPTALVELTRAC
jgi:hypothetical protein